MRTAFFTRAAIRRNLPPFRDFGKQNTRVNALVIGFPEGGGDPGLMWGNTGTLWGLCDKFLPLWWGKCGDLDFAPLSGRTWGLRFCSTERRLGTIDCSLYRRQDSPDRFKTESGEFRTRRKVEIFTRLRAAKVVFKKNYLKFNFHQSEC